MKKTIFAVCLAVVMTYIAAFTLCVRALSAPKPVFSMGEAGMRIVLDAGHGGVDGGVVGKTTGVKESDLNLAIVFHLRDVLEDMGFDVTLTRKTEAGLYGTAAKGFKKRDMQRRKEIIEEADPSLVISVHQNFYPSKTSRGGQVFYKKTDDRAKKFALAVQEQLNGLYAEEGAKARNAQAGEYFMLECSDSPSIIVECGFLSSPVDEGLLITDAWQRKIADGIAAGVMGYLSDFTA